MNRRRFAVAAAILLPIACFNAVASPVDVTRPDVAEFIEEMAEQHDFDRDALRDILGQAEFKSSIIEKISTPAERKLTWAEYRKIFMTRERINAGATFWSENREMLERINKETGVSIEMIVGIIGVETFYGRITGRDRVIDALATLAFEYPPRAKFFRNELVQFLLLAREEDIDATVPLGSYAGAMGRPQFMPSSFRAYAVDATGDGKRDIWDNWADVAGSIANYFLEHGWRPNEEVTSQATLSRPRPPWPWQTRWSAPLTPSSAISSMKGTTSVSRTCSPTWSSSICWSGSRTRPLRPDRASRPAHAAPSATRR